MRVEKKCRKSETSELQALSREPDQNADGGRETLDTAFGQACQLRLSFCASWDPYEVWCTRVRPEEEGLKVSRAHPDPPDREPGYPVKGKPSRALCSPTKAPPVLTWPVLMLAVALGLNRELMGIFRVDLVSWAFGVMTPTARIVHVILGVAAICAVVMPLSLAGRSIRD